MGIRMENDMNILNVLHAIEKTAQSLGNFMLLHCICMLTSELFFMGMAINAAGVFNDSYLSP